MASPEEEAVSCKNCGRPLTPTNHGIAHAESGLRRCLPWESGQPYGTEAEMAQ